MKSFLAAAGLALILMAAAGCAALFNSKTDPVAIQSMPSDADIYIDGNLRGRTPITLELQAKKTYTIVFKKPGYRDQAFELTNTVGVKWVILDVLGGLVPVIVDAATGSWYELDTKVVNVTLTSGE
ncbi:MAG: PEGA domain-containing protein [Gemmatimonadetes bacterium]|nr:PEGA domain-containing protein [Gemmatimonadota bacterium]